MLELIESHAEAAQAFARQDTAEVVRVLNEPTKRRDTFGNVSVALLADALSPEIAARFGVSVRGVVAALSAGSPEQQAEAELVEMFRSRFVNSSIDLANDKMRARLQGILTAADWSPEQIAPILALGYVLESPALQELGRAVTSEDVDLAYRQQALAEVEARSETANNAAAAVFRAGGTVFDIHDAAAAVWE